MSEPFTHRLTQGGEELMRGGGDSIHVILNNLTGRNFEEGRGEEYGKYLALMRERLNFDIKPSELLMSRLDAGTDYPAIHGSITRERLITQCVSLDSMAEALVELSRPGSFFVHRRREWGLVVVPAADKSWYVRKDITKALRRRPQWFTLEAADAENAYYVLSEAGRDEFMRQVRAGTITTATPRHDFDYLCPNCGVVRKRTPEQLERRRETITVECACGQHVELKPTRV